MKKMEVIARIKKEIEKESLSHARFGALIKPAMSRQQVGQILSGSDPASPETLNRMLSVFGLKCSVEVVETWTIEKK